MYLAPVSPGARLDGQRNAEFDRALHFLGHQLGDQVDLFRRNLEEKFVVHLNEHPRLALFLLEPRENGDHGALDDVGGAPLDDGVGGGALGGVARVAVAAVQIGEVAAAVEEGGDVASLGAFIDDFFDEGGTPAKRSK